MLTQNVAHECPKWCLEDKNYTLIYDKLPLWEMAENLNTLNMHRAHVASVLKAGDSDWYRVRNDYENILRAATMKHQPSIMINGVCYRKTWCRASIAFYHRWQHERIAYVLFIEKAIAKIENS